MSEKERKKERKKRWNKIKKRGVRGKCGKTPGWMLLNERVGGFPFLKKKKNNNDDDDDDDDDEGSGLRGEYSGSGLRTVGLDGLCMTQEEEEEEEKHAWHFVCYSALNKMRAEQVEVEVEQWSVQKHRRRE